MTPDEIVASQIGRFRRRLRLVRAVRFFCGVGVLAFAAASVGVSIVGARAGEALTAASALALVVTAVHGLVCAPSAREATAEADARLGLDDRLVTAAQCLNEQDPVSRLVVFDAAARIDGVAPSHAIGFEAPRHARRLVVVAAIACVVLAGAALSPRKGEDGLMLGPAQGRPLVEAEAAAAGAAAARAGSRITPVLVPRAAREGPQTPHPAEEQGTKHPGEEQGTRHGPQPEAQGTRHAGAGFARAERRADAAAGDRAGGRGAGSRAPAGSSGSEGRASRPGGQEGGSLVRAAAPPTTRPPAGDRYRARHRAAATQAETAIAREHVPDGLREYVRAYFVAIRP
jgi:hypothetical protein